MKKLVDVDVDVLVVGSEGAGATAAIEASKFMVKVLLVSKGRIGKCGATMTAGADFTIGGRGLCEVLGYDGDLRDSPELFMKEIVADGGFLSNQKLVEVYVRDAPRRVKALLDWGMRITGVEAAHGQEYTRAIRTEGTEAVKALRAEVKRRHIEVMEDTMVLDLLTRDGAVTGAVGLNTRTGDFIVFKAQAVVLATGGWQMAYSRTSATDDLTGDGQAMAYRAGAELVDMEMFEFISRFIWPGGLCRKLFSTGLTWIRDVGAYRINAKGERYLDRYDPTGRYRKAGHVPIEFIAIESEVAAGRGTPHGGVYLTVDGIPDVEKKLDEIEKTPRLRGWKFHGTSFKPLIEWLKTNKRLELGNAVHFHCGGIRIDEDCRTSIPGLFAAGECAGGLWGANRVAAATTQVVVQGPIAGRSAAAYALEASILDVDPKQVENIKEKTLAPLKRKEGVNPIKLRKRVQKIASEKIGVIKNKPTLEKAISELEQIKEDLPKLCTTAKFGNCNKEWIEALELDSMVTCLLASGRSALLRTESRMSHYRSDYLLTDNDNWMKNIIVKNVGGTMELSTQPVVVTTVPLPKGIWNYEEAHSRGSWAI